MSLQYVFSLYVTKLWVTLHQNRSHTVHSPSAFSPLNATSPAQLCVLRTCSCNSERANFIQLVYVWLGAYTYIYEIVFYVAGTDSLSLMKCFTGLAPFSHSCSAKGPKRRHLAGARPKTEIIRVLLPKCLFGAPPLLRPLRATHGCVYCTTTYLSG